MPNRVPQCGQTLAMESISFPHPPHETVGITHLSTTLDGASVDWLHTAVKVSQAGGAGGCFRESKIIAGMGVGDHD